MLCFETQLSWVLCHRAQAKDGETLIDAGKRGIYIYNMYTIYTYVYYIYVYLYMYVYYMYIVIVVVCVITFIM